MISGTLAAIAALNGARSAAVGAPPPIVAEPWSVLTVAPPRPGKCLAVGSDAAGAPAARSRPWWRCAARAGSRENARPASAAPLTRGHVGDGRERDVDAAPCERLRGGPGVAARDLARTAPTAGGAQSTLRISPPSWSVQTIGVAPGGLAGVAQRLRQRAQLLPAR